MMNDKTPDRGDRVDADGQPYVPFEQLEPAALNGWALSLQAIAGSTSYEDYLARLTALRGNN